MRKIFFVLFTVQVLFLVGCSALQTDKEKIYTFLEDVVALEEDFALQQKPLAELEKKENDVYTSILQEPSSNTEEIVKLSEEGIAIVEQIEDVVTIEKDSLEKSEEKFEDIDKLINSVDDANVKEILEQMKETMANRYKQYRELNGEYSNLLGLEKELYELFQDPNLSLDTLEQKLTNINNTYDAVDDLNSKFNELTRQYNEQKLNLYNELNIELK